MEAASAASVGRRRRPISSTQARITGGRAEAACAGMARDTDLVTELVLNHQLLELALENASSLDLRCGRDAVSARACGCGALGSGGRTSPAAAASAIAARSLSASANGSVVSPQSLGTRGSGGVNSSFSTNVPSNTARPALTQSHTLRAASGGGEWARATCEAEYGERADPIGRVAQERCRRRRAPRRAVRRRDGGRRDAHDGRLSGISSDRERKLATWRQRGH